MATGQIKVNSFYDPLYINSSYDLNELLPGFYFTSGANNIPAHLPDGYYNGMIMCIRNRAIDDLVQLFFCQNGGIIMYRQKFGGAWSSWKIVTMSNL